MSRIGKLPVHLPAGVSVKYENGTVTVKGPKGVLTQQISGDIDIKAEGAEVHVLTTGDSEGTNAKHGLYRALIQNMVTGVTEGYTVTLIVNGVGWKVAKSGKKLVLNIGFSHPIEFPEPEGVTFGVNGDKEITVSGIDKTVVGQTAANIRKLRLPEPYHGYGIRYNDEVIERKEGKTGGKGKK